MRKSAATYFIFIMGLFNLFSCKAQDFAIAPQFEAVMPFQNNLAPARLSGKWGFINKTGEWIVEPVFMSVEYDSSNIIVTENDGAEKIISFTGDHKIFNLIEIHITDQKVEAGDGNYFIKTINHFKGLYNEEGKEILEPTFDEIIYIGRNLFVCSEYGEGDFLYNTKGNELFHEILGEIIPEINRGRIQVRKNDKSGMIDTTGKIIMAEKYWRFEFAGNLIACTEGGKLGLIKNNGERISENKYDIIIPLNENRFFAENTDTGLGTIYSEEGEIIADEIFVGDGRMMFDLLPVKNKEEKYGYIDASGNVKIPYTFYYTATFFENGTALFGAKTGENNYAVGLIDTSGKIILPADYQQIFYKDGIYTVIQNDHFQLLDVHLQPITESQKTPVEYWGNGIYATYKFKTGIEYNRPSIWFGTKGGFSLYKEGVVTGVYDLSGNLLIEGNDYDENEPLPFCSEGLIPAKQKGKWGFVKCTN